MGETARLAVASAVEPVSLDGRFVRLRPISHADYQFLWQCRWHPEIMHVWTTGRTIPGFEQYAHELEAALSGQILTLLLIETMAERHPVGFVFAYDYSANDRYVFFNIVLTPPFSDLGWGAEALYLFVDYLFGFFDLHKVCMDVFDFNQHALALLLRNGAVQEGCFRGQRYYQGKHHDVIRLGVLHDEWQIARKALAELLAPPPSQEVGPQADVASAAITSDGGDAGQETQPEPPQALVGEASAAPDITMTDARAPRRAARRRSAGKDTPGEGEVLRSR